MSPPSPRRSSIEIEVRYKETDQMGVVHHSNYLVWFELARTNHCREAGLPYADIEEMGYWLMVTGANLKYRGGATYGETVRVECWLERLRSRLMVFGYDVKKGDDLLVSGTTEHVWVDRETGRNCRMPGSIEEVFTRAFDS